jgi:hypothetical protein
MRNTPFAVFAHRKLLSGDKPVTIESLPAAPQSAPKSAK